MQQERELFSHPELSHPNSPNPATESAKIPQPVFSDLVTDPTAKRQEAPSKTVPVRT